jgi:hypothetical protein
MGFFGHLLCIKMMILPRQARDKHRKNSKKARFVAGGAQATRRLLRQRLPSLPVPAPGNIRVKTAETSAIRVSYKITKTVSRHAEVQISGRFRSDLAVSTFKWALGTRRPPSLNLRGVTYIFA